MSWPYAYPIPLSDLRILEFCLCRAHIRRHLVESVRQLAADDKHAIVNRTTAIGSLLLTLINARADLMTIHKPGLNDEKLEKRYQKRIEQKYLAEIIRTFGRDPLPGVVRAPHENDITISESKLGEILRGIPARNDPFAPDIAGQVIKYILLGHTDYDVSRRRQTGNDDKIPLPTAAQDNVANRIVHFFFPAAYLGVAGNRAYSSRSREFFNEQILFSTGIQRTSDAIAEIYALATAANPQLISGPNDEDLPLRDFLQRKGTALIARTSALKRFWQVDVANNWLTLSGQASHEALRQGVDMDFVYSLSAPPTEADQSASTFSQLCQATSVSRLGVQVTNSSGGVFASDFLSTHIYFVYHTYCKNELLHIKLRRLAEKSGHRLANFWRQPRYSDRLIAYKVPGDRLAEPCERPLEWSYESDSPITDLQAVANAPQRLVILEFRQWLESIRKLHNRPNRWNV